MRSLNKTLNLNDDLLPLSFSCEHRGSVFNERSFSRQIGVQIDIFVLNPV